MVEKQRISQAHALMREQGIDGYLILTHDDYIYFFGEDRFQPRAIVPAQGSPIIVAFQGEADDIRRQLGVKDVRVFASVGQQINVVVGVMREMPGKTGSLTIAVQMGFETPAFLLQMFRRANPQVKVANVATVMDDLRMFKDDSEVELMRRAREIAVLGMEAAMRYLKPGAKELDVAAEAEYAMRKAGASRTATPIYVNSGVRSCWLHGTATEKQVEEGDMVVVDLVPVYRGYCANLCRTFVIGEPTEKQREIYDVYVRAKATPLEALKPGTRMLDVDATAKSVFDEAGYGGSYVAGISHGIGLGFEETPAPTIHPGHAGVPVQTRMALTVGHSVLSVPGVGGVRLEDRYFVAEDGPVPLTKFPARLALPIA